MKHLLKTGVFLAAVILFCSCSSSPGDRSWAEAIPQKSPFVILPQENATLNNVLESSYIPFLDDITSSAIQLVSLVDSTAASPLTLRSIVLYPGADDRLETVWITDAPDGFMETLREKFYRRFTQNRYYFHDATIHKLHIYDERLLFATRLDDVLLLSESSLALEDAARAYMGLAPALDLTNLQPEPGHVIMNTPFLDGWFEQFVQVAYRPVILKALQGTGPALLSVSEQGEEQNREFGMTGRIPLTSEPPTEMVSAISSANAPVSLDGYISSNAAAFALLRMEPRLAPPTSVPDTSTLDQELMDDKVRYARLAKTLSMEFGMVMFTESGFLSTGEHLFLRKVNDVSALREQLRDLQNRGLIERPDNTWFIRSRILAQMIGGKLCTFDNFWLTVTGEAVVISRRKGLTEIVASDRSRRRVITYDSDYRRIKENLSSELSGLFVATSDFYSFLEPFLYSENYMDAITSTFDLMAVSTQLDEQEEHLAFNLRTYKTTERTAPYEERWLMPADNSSLTGEPVLADIGGSPRDEIVFATESGKVFALAADGTVAFEAETGDDIPVGSPVVYDWYGSGQNVILVAAGNKVYGWNENGNLLPQFPFSLNEQITTPLVVEDVTRNGLPEALVATADRRLHLLDNRGQDRNGWPVTTNTVIESKPAVEQYYGSRSILAFSANAVHAWEVNGTIKEEFPKFINASLTGSPVVQNGNILAGAADGYLYSVGPNRLFADTLDAYNVSEDNPSDIESIYISSSSISGLPSVQQNLRIEGETGAFTGTMLLTMDSNGSVYLLSQEGRLLFNKNMGQPTAGHFSAYVTDLNSDSEQDVVTLGDFGRLYAWQISNGERLHPLPTTGMRFPVVADIDGDGYKEVIAHTTRGLRCWTIYGSGG